MSLILNEFEREMLSFAASFIVCKTQCQVKGARYGKVDLARSRVWELHYVTHGSWAERGLAGAGQLESGGDRQGECNTSATGNSTREAEAGGSL